MTTSIQALKFFETIVNTKSYLKPMLERSKDKNFPMRGIEHIFIQKKGKTYCRFCGFDIDNLMHIPPKD